MHTDPAAKIVSERLYLRALGIEDCTARYSELLNDPAVARFLETRHVRQTARSVEEFVAAVNARDNEFLFGIFLRANDKHIGNIKVGPIHPHHRVGDVSLWLDPAEWGKGFATEAITAMSRHAFTNLGAVKLSAGMYAANRGSYRAFIKAGYRDEGCRKAHYAFEGGRSDVWLVGKVRVVGLI